MSKLFFIFALLMGVGSSFSFSQTALAIPPTGLVFNNTKVLGTVELLTQFQEVISRSKELMVINHVASVGYDVVSGNFCIEFSFDLFRPGEGGLEQLQVYINEFETKYPELKPVSKITCGLPQ